MPILADLSEIRVGASPRGRLEAVAAGGERVVHAKDLGPGGDIDSDRLTRVMDRFGETAPRLRPGDVLLQSRGVVAPKPGDRICDPACGSASMLLRAGEYIEETFKSRD